VTGPAARADRAVLGDVAHSLVITGDRNRVVVSLTGSDLPPVRVRRPRRRSRAERLLFGAVGAVGAGDRPLLWLRPDAGVIRVRPRAEDAALRAWCDDGASRVRLVCGRGGQGKTTTARRLVADLRAEGWLAGFADLSGVTSDEVGSEPVRRRWAELAAAMGSRPVRRGRVLLVVDYAEDEPLALRRLLGLVRDAPSVRLLLLSRTEGDWWPALVADPAWSRLVDPGVVPLRSITDDLTPAEVGEVWVDAVRRFAARLGVEVAPTAPDRAFATTLDLYADALLRVLGADAADAGGDPVRGLLAHELRHVRAVLDEQRVPVRPGDQALALLAPFLAPAARVEEAAGALGALGVVADPDPAVLRRAARALGRLYPDVHDGDPGRAVGVWAPPRPDRLPDTHVLVVAAQAPSDEDWAGLVLGLCGGDDVGRAARVVRVLARCLTTPGAPEHHPDGLRRVALAVDRLVREHPKGYALPVVVLLPGRFTPALAAALAGLTTAEVAAIDRAVRAFGPSTRRAADAVLLSRRLARDTAPVPGADHAALGRHAGELHRLATDLSGAGQRQEAYAAARRAVEVYRGLVVAGREEHLPDLTAALSGLAGRLSEGGPAGRGAHRGPARGRDPGAARRGRPGRAPARPRRLADQPGGLPVGGGAAGRGPAGGPARGGPDRGADRGQPRQAPARPRRRAAQPRHPAAGPVPPRRPHDPPPPDHRPLPTAHATRADRRHHRPAVAAARSQSAFVEARRSVLVAGSRSASDRLPYFRAVRVCLPYGWLSAALRVCSGLFGL